MQNHRLAKYSSYLAGLEVHVHKVHKRRESIEWSFGFGRKGSPELPCRVGLKDNRLGIFQDDSGPLWTQEGRIWQASGN